MDTFQDSVTFWRFAAQLRAARGFKTAHFRAAIVTLFLLLSLSGCGHKAAPFRAAAEKDSPKIMAVTVAAAEGLAVAGESLQGFAAAVNLVGTAGAPAAEIRA